jgi:hypothetical protein
MNLMMKVGFTNHLTNAVFFFSWHFVACILLISSACEIDHLSDIEEEFVIEEDGPKDFETMQFLGEGNYYLINCYF